MNGCMSGFGGMPNVELTSKGLQQLKGEHPPLLAQLEELYSLTEKINQEVEIETNFAQLVKKAKEFRSDLDPHSEREEGVLFPMLGAYIGMTSGPIAVMEYEHDQAKENIRTFLEDGDYNQSSPEELKKWSKLIQNAYFILTEHFTKEETVLFPMAERMLSEEEKDELYQRIQEIK